MASLILSDGTIWQGEGFGAQCDSDGEVVFSTGMVGYSESMTDPSFRGQILTFTYPLIGNYGVPKEERNEWGFSRNFESEEIHVRGVICAQVSEFYSHHAAVESLPSWMQRHGIPGITGIDTRALTEHLREKGVMLGRIICDDSVAVSGERGAGSASEKELIANRYPLSAAIDDPNLRNLVAEVSCKEVIRYEPKERLAVSGERVAEEMLTVLAYDCGMKRNILRSFLRRGVKVVRVPYNFDITSYREPFDGLFVSNGPGDPRVGMERSTAAMQWAIEKNIPTFGICLGNQILGMALGDSIYKLKYGHRGVNQPCNEFLNGKPTGRCIITSQNHGYSVSGDHLPKGWSVWFRNANDQSVEGIRHSSGRFCSVQFHPEATPGPEDANYLFDEFVECMRDTDPRFLS